jgi:hypothetical protein
MRGRRPTGPEYVWKLDGSSLACQRLQVILQTLGGEQSLQDACAELGIAPTRFHQLRQEALQAALAELEPGRAGRPGRAPQDPRISQLEAEVHELRLQLQAANVRAEIAAVLPLPAGRQGRCHEDAAAAVEQPEAKKTRRRQHKRPSRRRR